MRGARALLRVGEYLVARACCRLPPGTRDDRYREWAAELPAILHDREIRFAVHRAVRMLGYAADTLRGTALTPGQVRRRPAAPATLLLGLRFIAGLVVLVWGIWDTVRAPGDGLNYVHVAWSLFLVAWPISEYLSSGTRTTGLIAISSSLAGVAVCIWDATQAPGDWVNYFMAASFSLLLLIFLAGWLITRSDRTGGHNTGRAGNVTASLSGLLGGTRDLLFHWLLAHSSWPRLTAMTHGRLPRRARGGHEPSLGLILHPVGHFLAGGRAQACRAGHQ